jgi:hypothetical protein
MKHISEIIEDILVEWAYRVHDGMPNPKNTLHIIELRESMEELNLPNNVIYQVIQNLINEQDDEYEKDKKEMIKWKDEKGEDRETSLATIKTYKYADDYLQDKDKQLAVKAAGLDKKDDKDTPEKEKKKKEPKKVTFKKATDFLTGKDDKPSGDTDETSKVSKTLLQAPPEKESTSARNKRRQQINEETDKIIKESKGDIQVVANLINKRRETLDKLWDKPAGGGGSLVGEMYGGVSAEEVAHNSDMSEDDFTKDKMKRLKGTALYKELAAKAKTNKKYKKNPDAYIEGWVRNAYNTGKSEVDYLESEPKFKYKKPQTKPMPVGVTMDYNQRQVVKSTLESKLEEAKKSGNKKQVAHYEKQLRYLDKLADTDTGLLYETTDGMIGFKHTSNKNGWDDPHNNTSVRVKGERIQKISETVGQQNNLSTEDTKKMQKKLNNIIDEGANIVDNAEKVVENDIKDVDTDEFAKNNAEVFNHLGRGRAANIDYAERTRQEPSVREHLEKQGINADEADNEQLMKACVELVKSGKATADIKKMILKTSDLVESVNKLKTKGLKKTGPMSDEQIAEHLDLPLSVVTSLQNPINDKIKETSRKRKNSMEVAHEKIVSGMLNSDAELGKEKGESYYPNPEDADNGPHTQTYVNSFMEEIHFTRYIDGELEGVQSINIDGTNVTPQHFRGCLGELSGFDGESETPEGKEALKTHLRKKMRVSPEGSSISFNAKDKGGKNIEVGKEVYRTKGNAKSILAHLGDDIQDCLKKKATEK